MKPLKKSGWGADGVGMASAGRACRCGGRMPGQNIRAGAMVASGMPLPIFFALGRKKLSDYLVNTLIISIFVYGFKTEDIKIQRIFGPV